MKPEAGGADLVSRGEADPRGVPGVVFDSYPESRVENSQPAGIGRVVALERQCAWNNLGRNVVFASRSFQPEAVFDQTSYPDDDELPSTTSTSTPSLRSAARRSWSS